MRFKLALACLPLTCLAFAAAAPTASAQAGYYGYQPGGGVNQQCVNARNNNRAAGAVAGAILGGVLGSNVAARGHRGDGTALGAVVGGVIGSEVGRGNTNCRTEVYGPPAAYSGYGPNVGYDAYPTAGAPYGYGAADPYSQPYGVQQPYGQNETFGRDYRYDEPLAGAPRPSYTGQYRDHEFAGRECADAKQITRLPDGTEIHRPVEACRDAYYGGWTVRD